MRVVVASDPAQPNDSYRGALLCAGALPEEVLVVRPGDPLPQEIDGLLVAGGADVDPARYGAAPETPTLEVVPARDALDYALFESARAQGAPVFGICRGLQMLNVALGGTLWQDVPSQRERGVPHDFGHGRFPGNHPAHAVRVRRGDGPIARILGSAPEMTVNSRHHQAVKDLAPGLAAVASSPDDLVEAFEGREGPFLAAVQWHPENMVADPLQKALFSAFLDACRVREAARGRATPPLIEVILEGRIPVVRINRPARRNAFAGNMRGMLAETIEALGQDPTAPAIVLTGASGAFSAGGDVEVLRALAEAGDVAGFRQLLHDGARAVLAVVRAPKPVIAAIDGPAAGAGMNLALACDVRAASASPAHEAVFAQSFAAIGLAPDWGGSFHLPWLAGSGAAADLAFSAERIPVRRARELGLVDLLVEDGPALPAALARAATYAERPAAALAAAKALLNADRLPRLSDALARETEAQVELFRTPGFAARLKARPRTEPSPQETP